MSGPAYDYDRQEWVTSGPRAQALLVAQARDVLSVIDEPGYRTMMGHSDAEAARVKAAAQHVLRTAGVSL